MKNLRKVLAGMLIAIPMLSLGATEVSGRLPGAQVDGPKALAACCYVRIGGTVYCIPC